MLEVSLKRQVYSREQVMVFGGQVIFFLLWTGTALFLCFWDYFFFVAVMSKVECSDVRRHGILKFILKVQ